MLILKMRLRRRALMIAGMQGTRGIPQRRWIRTAAADSLRPPCSRRTRALRRPTPWICVAFTGEPSDNPFIRPAWNRPATATMARPMIMAGIRGTVSRRPIRLSNNLLLNNTLLPSNTIRRDL